MRIVTNRARANRNRKMAHYLSFGSLAILAASFFLVNPQIAGSITGDAAIGTAVSTLALLTAVIATPAAVRMTNTWVREPRPEKALQDGLKGVSTKSVLYSYYHDPARHVLVTPQGVFVIVTRFQNGRYTVSGGRWTTHRSTVSRMLSLFRQDQIGNPTRDARRAAAHVRALLSSIEPNIDVQPLIVFLDARAQLQLENLDVPVVYTDARQKLNLKDHLRDWHKTAKTRSENDPGEAALTVATLTPDQIDAFEEATVPA